MNNRSWTIVITCSVIVAVAVIASIAYVSWSEDQSTEDISNTKTGIDDIGPEIIEPQKEGEENVNGSSDPQITDAERNIQEEIQEKIEEIEKQREENPEYEASPREWITSGPFQIDRAEYVLGEKIFVRIGALSQTEKGQIAFLRPLNDTHYSVYQAIPFDGAKKSAFNYYLEPKLSKSQKICSEEDLLGYWTVVFRGTDYPNISFEIVNKTIPGDEERYYKSIC